jgi:prevent-host-death family protein
MSRPETVVNIHAAKTHLSRLLERAEQGDETVIARAGRPIARLVPYRPSERARTPGVWRGRMHILPGFDELDADIARLFGTEAAPRS